MVSLAVSSGLQSLFPDDSRGEHLPLRTTEFWYPEVPPSSHYLYDDTFAGRNVSLYDYRPLVRVMFVTVSNAAVVGIDFFYTDDSLIKRLQACPSTAGGDDSVKIPFLIDGLGDERITSFQSDGDFFCASGGY
ncbi:hypothetical protein ETB97_001800 [Aspergillus alliaceus]|uniref:Uncharacterized protein n=1 Tax=Petromyces alliaceus TaxID=209559 RepID=A0A8H6E5J8_PETAA|nr:hypothetical protein ETB97_001800 [Aspergillus burnettii]